MLQRRISHPAHRPHQRHGAPAGRHVARRTRRESEIVTQRLAGKIALITGASRGIGVAVAERYAQEGAHVILVARSVAGLEATDDRVKKVGGDATLVPMDLRDGDKIDQLGAAIAARFGKLDILVGNAGMLGELSPVPHIDPTVWGDVIATNLTANYRLIRSLDPLLRAAGHASAMFVTSGVTQGDFPFWGSYAASKAGLEALVNTYAAEVAHLGMGVYLVDPGIVRTEMREAAFPGEKPDTLPAPESITDIFVELAEHSERTSERRRCA
ncbi:MAG: SDR family NAD(P)-dependent oxidoreductase [Alphaproteobacteria bacterium]|nr:SDR family NAD(P)-dependent oxidoreductase [Alphaproteobacteria bacterium]